MSRSVLRVSVLGAILSLLAAGATGRGEDAKEKGEKPIELNVGDPAPKFELRTDADTTWSSSDRVGKKWLVIHFPIYVD